MSEGRAVYSLIDVRDMLCAQALAQADQAIQRLPSGAILELVCNGEDVRDDLLAWAKQTGHSVLHADVQASETWIKVQKRP